MTNSKILELKDIKKIQPKLDLLDIIPQELAIQTQTLVYDQDDLSISVLTTNKNPTLYHQVIDKLEAQGYTYTTYFTDQESFTYALGRYAKHTKAQAKEDKEAHRKSHALGDDAI
jgi:hypothetical protein